MPVSSETYEIVCLKYAEYTNRKRFESFLMAEDHGGPHPIASSVWIIRNAARTIVVDTGFDEAEGIKRNRRIARTPAKAMELIGVSADQAGDLGGEGGMGGVLNAFHEVASDAAESDDGVADGLDGGSGLGGQVRREAGGELGGDAEGGEGADSGEVAAGQIHPMRLL